MNLVESLEKSLPVNDKIPQLSSGDTVRVHQKIVEEIGRASCRERV